jgi:DNA-binding CsgD family transcriptional regulator
MSQSLRTKTIGRPWPQGLRESAATATELRTERLPEVLDLLASGYPPAFATDSRDRIVFWNEGATELLGRRPDQVLGRHCYEAIGGRDVRGHCFCRASCPVVATLFAGRPVPAFELEVSANGHGRRLAHVTILRIPSVRPDLHTIVHILAPIDTAKRLAQSLVAPGAAPATVPREQAAVAPPDTPPPLSHREQEVLQWVASGLQNKEIARELGLSPATVRNHVHNLLEKLEVHSKLEAVSLAFRRGWVRREQAG